MSLPAPAWWFSVNDKNILRRIPIPPNLKKKKKRKKALLPLGEGAQLAPPQVKQLRGMSLRKRNVESTTDAADHNADSNVTVENNSLKKLGMLTVSINVFAYLTCFEGNMADMDSNSIDKFMLVQSMGQNTCQRNGTMTYGFMSRS